MKQKKYIDGKDTWYENQRNRNKKKCALITKTKSVASEYKLHVRNFKS